MVKSKNKENPESFKNHNLVYIYKWVLEFTQENDIKVPKLENNRKNGLKLDLMSYFLQKRKIWP